MLTIQLINYMKKLCLSDWLIFFGNMSARLKLEY